MNVFVRFSSVQCHQDSNSLILSLSEHQNDPFCSERVTMHSQWGRKTPKTAPSPWDFITLLEEDRATAIGNMH